MAYSTDVLATTGIQSYFKLNESSGNAADSKGSLSGTVGAGVTRGSASLVTESGAAYTFDQGTAASTVTFGDNYDFTGTSTFSIECWVRLTAGQTHHFVSKYGGSSVGGWYVGTNSSRIPFFVRHDGANSTVVAATDFLNYNQTYHFVFTYDGTNMRIYQDGTQVASGSSSRSLPNTSANLAISDRANLLGTTGRIDEVAIYNTALSQTTAAAHYTSGTAVSLTAVGKSSAQSYAVKTAVGKSSSQSYAALVSVGKSRSGAYALVSTVGNSTSQGYTVTVAATVGSTLNMAYGTSVPVGRSLSIGHFAEGVVGNSRSIAYGVRAFMHDSQGVSYSVRQYRGKSLLVASYTAHYLRNLVDRFTTNSGLWTLPAGASITGGRLQMNANVGDVSVQTVGKYEALNDQLEFDATPQDIQDPSYSSSNISLGNTEFALVLDENNKIGFFKGVRTSPSVDEGDPYMQPFVVSNGVRTNIAIGATGQPPSTQYFWNKNYTRLRIRESAGNVYFAFYDSVAEVWSPERSTPTPAFLSNPVFVRFLATGGGGAAYVDNVNAGFASKRITSSYGIIARVGNSRASTYNVLNTVGRSRSGAFSVTGTVGKSVAAEYTVAQSAGRSLSGNYKTLRNIGRNLNMAYLERAYIGRSLEVVSDSLIDVGADLALANVVLSPVGTTTEQSYGLRSEVGDTQTLSYQTFHLAGSSLLLSEGISAFRGRSLVLGSHSLNVIGRTSSVTYGSRHRVGASLEQSYAITATWRGQSLRVAYKTNQYVSRGRLLIAKTLNTAALSLAQQYSTSALVGNTLGISVTQIGRAGKSLTLSGHITVPVQSQRGFAYILRNPAARNQTVAYMVAEALPTTKVKYYSLKPTKGTIDYTDPGLIGIPKGRIRVTPV